LNSLSDNSLMLKVKAGDLDKMALLFERYHRVLFGFLYHSTNHRATSEDLVQTVFYRMLKYRHTFTGEGEFRTWMYHLARNVLNDEFKKTNRLFYQENYIEISDKSYSESDLENRLEQIEVNEVLQKSLSKLSNEHREVLVLSRFQDLSYQEIGEILNISEANVKVRVHRAIKELRHIYLKEMV
jgi:RNA polymerase sigma factor (sigma-70 family)